MADQAEMTTGATGYVDKPMRKQYMLFFGVAAQFSYVGAQVGIAAYFINFFAQARPDLNVTQAHQQGANFYAIAQSLFAVGRFSAAGLMYIMKPRWVLMVYQTMIMVCYTILESTKRANCMDRSSLLQPSRSTLDMDSVPTGAGLACS
jgi:FHS family L-fucose permease-like MFS transporter